MVRSFTKQTLPGGLVESLCDQARHAPSAGHTQAVSFLVLDSPGACKRYWETTLPPGRRPHFSFPQLLNAPALVLVLVSPQAYLDRYSEPDKLETGRGSSFEAWPVPFWWVDSGAAVQNLLLLVTNTGLGACLVGLFDNEKAVHAEFGLEPEQRIVAAVAIGYRLDGPFGRSSGRPWKPVDEVIRQARAGQR